MHCSCFSSWDKHFVCFISFSQEIWMTLFFQGKELRPRVCNLSKTTSLETRGGEMWAHVRSPWYSWVWKKRERERKEKLHLLYRTIQGLTELKWTKTGSTLEAGQLSWYQQVMKPFTSGQAVSRPGRHWLGHQLCCSKPWPVWLVLSHCSTFGHRPQNHWSSLPHIFMSRLSKGRRGKSALP